MQVRLLIPFILLSLGLHACKWSPTSQESLATQALTPAELPFPLPQALRPGDKRLDQTSFLVVGDTGTGSDQQWRTALAMTEFCKSSEHTCDFVLLLGDNFYPSGIPSDTTAAMKKELWQTKFFKPYAGLDIPFFAIPGNHDYVDHGWGAIKDKKRIQNQILRLNDLIYLSQNEDGSDDVGVLQIEGREVPKWYMPNRYYFWSYHQLAQFIALDTTMLVYDADPKQLSEEVATQEFLYTKATQSQLDWQLVYGHHPIYSQGKHGDAGFYNEWRWNRPSAFFGGEHGSGLNLKRFIEKKCSLIDIYFAGHEHNTQVNWNRKECPHMLHVVAGAGGRLPEPKVSPTPSSGNSLFVGDSNGFVYVQLSKRKLNLQIIAVNSVGKVNLSPKGMFQCSKSDKSQRCDWQYIPP